jgi:hypothetical protein
MVKQQQAPTSVGFRNYFEQLEEHLGALLVPIQPRATGPRQIVTAEALHADLARRAAIEVYRENKCLGMESPVRLFPTLDALGRLRFKAEDSSTTDQASVEFLESLGEATLSILGTQSTSDSEPDPNSS